MKKIIVYFDMDGVLVQYPAGQEGPKDFLEMPPIQEVVDLYHELDQDERYEVYLASTAPWSNPEAWMAKRLWVDQYLGEASHKKLVLTHNKHLLIGDYLIDDRAANGAENFQGEWIQYREGVMSIEEIKERIGY